MTDVTQLSPQAVYVPEVQIREGVVNEDATKPGDEVRCVEESLSSGLTTDPMAWMPYVNGEGVFYPKRGDRAVISRHGDGPGVILTWWPQAATPDHAF